jgi:ubiquitin
MTKRTGMIVAAALVAAMLVGPSAFAKGKKPTVSCKQIKDAMASGKSAEDVQKDMNVTASRVKSCTAPAHHKHTSKKAS